MWPFSRNKQSDPIPAIRCGNIDVTWDLALHWWEFSDGGIDYTQSDNAIFDPSVLKKLPNVAKWLKDLAAEIDEEIMKHLEGWCEWNGQKELVGIDISWLVTKNEVDVSYWHEEWGDLVINIVITDGRIPSSDAGD